MTFEKLINELECSTESYNVLIRAYESASSSGYGFINCTETRKRELCEKILKVSTYGGLAAFVHNYGCYIRNFGYESEKEVIALCNKKGNEVQDEHKWYSVEDKRAPLGVPLICKTRDNTAGGVMSIKYPIYYAKEPYEDKCSWYFFAVDGMSKLLPEYSEVIEWKEVHE